MSLDRFSRLAQVSFWAHKSVVLILTVILTGMRANRRHTRTHTHTHTPKSPARKVNCAKVPCQVSFTSENSARVLLNSRWFGVLRGITFYHVTRLRYSEMSPGWKLLIIWMPVVTAKIASRNFASSLRLTRTQIRHISVVEAILLLWLRAMLVRQNKNTNRDEGMGRIVTNKFLWAHF